MVLLTGEPEDTWRQVIADLTPRSVTIVMLMALRKRALLAEVLLARGWPSTTPVAIVFAATSPTQARVLTALAELATLPDPIGVEGAPGVLVIGDVVAVAHELDALAASPEAGAMRAEILEGVA
jgi:siroheme synthase